MIFNRRGIYRTHLKCVGFTETSGLDEWTMMELEEFDDDTCKEPWGFLNHGTWIKGLSSMDGILKNTRFGAEGAYGFLLEVYDNKTLIYSRGSIGVEETTANTIPDIKVDGRSVSVSTNVDSCGSLFSQTGLHIGDYKFSGTPTVIDVPDSGVYILKIGNLTKKVLIQ